MTAPAERKSHTGMSKQKILFIIDRYISPYAGTEGQLHKLVRYLDRTLYEPHLLVFNTSEYIQSGDFPCPVTVLGQGKLLSPKMWQALHKALHRFAAKDYRIAHIFFNDASLIGPPLLVLHGFKVIISRRDMGFWYTPFYRYWLRINRFFVTKVIANSLAVKMKTSKTEWIPTSRIDVIYNGYEAAQRVGDTDVLIKKLREGGCMIIGIVANLRPIKRIGDSIEALSRLDKRFDNTHLLIVGGGDPAPLASLAAEKGVLDRVHFMGRQSQPSRFIADFDIGLLNSESEGFSNAIIEYLQWGKPVICSNVGGNPEIIEPGINGLLYECGDLIALTEQLTMLLEDASLRIRMGAEGKRLVESRFAMKGMVLRHQELYQKLGV